MRLFYALGLDEQSLSEITGIQDMLEPLLEKGKRSAVTNLHLTLSFLGEQDPCLLPTLKQVLQAIPADPIQVQVSHLGRFAKQGGDIIWLGVQDPAKIASLQALLVAELKRNGIKSDEVSFFAHITLFRNARIGRLPVLTQFNCRLQSLQLFHSHQVAHVLTYTPIATKFLLGK